MISEDLRLEVEIPTAGLPNLVQNPSGEQGAWFYSTPVNNTTLTKSTVLTPSALAFKTTVSQAARLTTELMPLAAGRYASARIDLVNIEAGHNIKVRFEWFDVSKALISSSTQSAALTGTTLPHYIAPVVAPAGTAYVKFRIDFYNGTGNPSANATFNFRNLMVTHAATSAEIQTVRKNLITNPSFETNATGTGSSWATVARTTAQAYTGTASLAVTSTATGATAYAFLGDTPTTRAVVTGGTTYTFTVRTKAGTTPRGVALNFTWFDAAGNTINSIGGSPTTNATGAWTAKSMTVTAPSTATKVTVGVGIAGPTAGEVHYLDGVILEAGTTSQPYFDGASTPSAGIAYAWTGTAHASSSTETTSNFAFVAPNDWRNILNEAHEINIDRKGFDVGLLTATVLDPLLDPAVEASMRPGKKIRLQAFDGSIWGSVYEGKISNAQTEYLPTKVTISASDNHATLANQPAFDGVSLIDRLPWVLEGKGVPWNVNGSGNQVTGVVPRTFNPNATALDQVAATRDTNLGFAWVDRENVLQVWDGNLMPTTPDATIDSTVFTGIDVGFNTAEGINTVLVKYQKYSVARNETTEIPKGPYIDPASVATWGPLPAEFVYQGDGSETAATFLAFATAILNANANPSVQTRGIRIPIRTQAAIGSVALGYAELYKRLAVVRPVEGGSPVTDTVWVTGVKHTITAGQTDAKWVTDLAFENAAFVARPKMIKAPPPPHTGSNAPRAGEVTINVPALNTNYSGTITFDPPFVTKPTVQVTPEALNPENLRLGVYQVTTTGATIRIQKTSGLTGNHDVHWTATART